MNMVPKKHPLIAIFILIAAWSAFLWFFVRSLPDVRPLKNPRHNMTMMVKNDKGKKVTFVVGQKNPYWTPLSGIPTALQWGVIMGEDDTFYWHNGFNFSAMREALWQDIKAMKPVRGGSTITQQLAKNLYLSREKSIERKIKEAVITCKLEKHLTKGRILELYLNVIEWAPGARGVGEASLHYFHKTPAELDFFESVLLAAIIPSPRIYNPIRYPERAMDRYRLIVSLMYKSKLITLYQYEIASAAKLLVDPVNDTIFISPLL